MNALQLAFAGAVLAAAANTASATTMYVDDRLQLGLHAENNLASSILELLPSGTEMEVVVREGSMARVRLPDGREGWVDASFLVEEAPGRVRLQKMETQMDALKAELADAQAQLAETQANLAQAPSADTQDNPGETIPSETLREMQQLVEENQRLKQTVSELQALERVATERAEAAERAAQARSTAPAENEPKPASKPQGLALGIMRWERWQQILLASVLLLAFAAGGWLVDWGVRRRHGGFRV